MVAEALQKSAAADLQPAAAAGGRQQFTAPFSDYKRGALFMLSLSLVGLQFWPALAMTVICLLSSWRSDRMHFMMQLTIFTGTYGLYRGTVLPVLMSDVMLAVSVVLLLVMRKDLLMRRVLWAFAGYLAVLLLLSTRSVESLTIQLLGIRQYMHAIVFMVFLAVFSGERFDIMRFFQLAMVYELIFCAFYVIDGFVLQGWILMPSATGGWYEPTFWQPVLRPFSTWFPRIYPPGLYLMALCIFPLIYVYRLSIKQWVLVGLAFMASRTMTVLAGLVVTALLFQPKVRRVILSCVGAVVVFAGLYIVDSASGGFLRIASTVEQFVMLETVKDEEDLANFGSTRMAQVIPKIDLLFEQGRQWIGFGFIHPEKSKNSAVQLTNELYSDIEKAEENVADVEVTQVHTLLMAGYIGLIAQTVFYVGLFFILRPCRYRRYYLSMVICLSIFGIGGFGGLTQQSTLTLLALVIAVVLLQHRQEQCEVEDAKA